MDQAVSPLQAKLRANYLRDEDEALRELLALARLDPAASARVLARARALVEKVRASQVANAGMQSFLREYDLSSQEGVLLMCVAEWERHVGRNRSLLVNAGTWGMMLTGRLVSLDSESSENAAAWLGRLAARAGEPVVRMALRQGMKLMAEQFVMGRTIGDALGRSRQSEHAAYLHSYDMLGEAAFTAADAERYFTAYANAIDAIAAHASATRADAGEHPRVFGNPGISIKLSALHPRYEYAQRERVLAELVPRVRALVERARAGDVGVTLDAEEADRLGLSLEVFERVFESEALRDWEGLGLAVQAYLKRAPFVIDWLGDLSRRHRRRIMVRLVKGAYWDTEVKRAQVQGLSGYPVYTRKANTDVSYLACAAKIIAAPDAFYGQFATHNAHTLASVLERVAPGQAFEFQRLHGMGEDLYGQVVTQGRACRVYAPVGSYEDLLPYLVRRLLENGANTSFVNRIADEAIPVEQVVADPVAIATSQGPAANPKIPLPFAPPTSPCGCRSPPSSSRSSPRPGTPPRRWSMAARSKAPGGRSAILRAARRSARWSKATPPRRASRSRPPRARAFRRPASAPQSLSAPRCGSNLSAPSCLRCSRGRRARRFPTPWARCARRPISAATTRCSRAATSPGRTR